MKYLHERMKRTGKLSGSGSQLEYSKINNSIGEIKSDCKIYLFDRVIKYLTI